MIRAKLLMDMTHSIRKLKFVLGVVLLLSVSAFSVQATSGKTTTKVRLDDSTMKKGYTIVRDGMQLGIQANTFERAAPVWLRTMKSYPKLPKYLELASDVYVYTIDVEEAGYVETPLWLQYSYEEETEYQRSFYYYDSRLEKWIKLPTFYDSANDRVRAGWHFTYSIIAVLDDTRYDAGPRPSNSYHYFGDIGAEAAIAIDQSTGAVLYNKNADTKRSIASLTKLMTAYVLFENGINLDKEIVYSSSYDQEGASLHMNDGDILSMQDLMYAMAIGSANNAAYALVDQAGYSLIEFVAEMNAAAKKLGLEDTTFADPSGLNPNNVSTASDYALFLREALRNGDVYTVANTSSYVFTTRNTGEAHSFKHTNYLMHNTNLDIRGSKTGYLDEALYCLAMNTREDGHEVITVVLGAPTWYGRFSESERLVNWTLSNYDW